MTANTESERAGPLAALPPWLSMTLAFLGLGIVIFGVLLLMGAALEPPTIALSLAGVALVFAVWRMFAIVHALAVPANAGVEIQRVGGARRSSLEDEFQRLLRSIKELEFDHEMGKISDQDFEQMEVNYRARALEVMRELEKTEALHPSLQRLLAVREEERSGGFLLSELEPASSGRGRTDASQVLRESSGDAAAEETASARICDACGGSNDDDARFCKHCGKELVA